MVTTLERRNQKEGRSFQIAMNLFTTSRKITAVKYQYCLLTLSKIEKEAKQGGYHDKNQIQIPP